MLDRHDHSDVSVSVSRSEHAEAIRTYLSTGQFAYLRFDCCRYNRASLRDGLILGSSENLDEAIRINHN